MATGPRVSICIPTYNQVQYLPATLESALAQDYDNLEIVLSENHCSDGTAEYLATIADPRLRVVRPSEHSPMYDNFAFCVSQSEGEYFNCVSSDDLLFPSYVSTLSERLRLHPSAAFAHCPARLIDERGTAIGVERRVGGSFFRKGTAELRRVLSGPGCTLSTVMVRRSCYDRTGGFRSWKIVGDWDIMARLLTTGDVVYCDRVLAAYRRWSTPGRTERLAAQIHEIAQMYEMVLPDLLKGYPRLLKDLPRFRRAQAAAYALGAGQFFGTPEFEKVCAGVRRIHDSAYVRSLLSLHRFGATEAIRNYLALRGWLRQKTKALLYPT